MSLESLAGIVAGQMSGGKKEAAPEAAQEAAGVIGSAGQAGGGMGTMAGSAAGGLVGSIFGPAGSVVGSALGGQLGGATEKGLTVPAGPGPTIGGGTVDTSQRSGHEEAAISVAESLGRLATRGITNRIAPDGLGKKF